MSNYSEYMEKVKEDVKACIENMGCQPILFIGAGVSRRYFNSPSWKGLLEQLGEECPKITMPFAYYEQMKTNLIEIGSVFSEEYSKWAWEEQEKFPQELFRGGFNQDIYFKYKVAEVFKEITPHEIDKIEESFIPEIEALQNIRPHAIITTNYDGLLELLFPEYTPIIGQKILKNEYSSIGEIFKIHGCCSECESIVITDEDYKKFKKKKKYLSAKLMAYFAEHPLILIGYSAEDPNIKSILSDIDELLTTEDNEVVPNIYFLEWKEEIKDEVLYSRERLIPLEESKSMRVKNIVANDFKWVFDAFSVEGVVEKINPKLLRALLARTYELVRTDIPQKTIEVDYKSLSPLLEKDGDVAQIYGVSFNKNPESFNIGYPFTLTDVGKELGYLNWNKADQLLKKIVEEKGVDIKISDNKYHVAIPTGSSGSVMRKYSHELVEMLKKVKNDEEYNVFL